MKKLILIGVAVVLVSGLVAGIGVASSESGHPAAKATAMVSNVAIMDADRTTDMDWTPILEQTIKTANQKDLFIDVSLQAGLYTRTKGKSKRDAEGDPIADTAKAFSSVNVKVTVEDLVGGDTHMVYPEEVVFAERTQELTVLLQGILELCTVDEVLGLCVVGEEYVELILDTMSANSFNFIAADLDSGVHKVTVWAAIDLDDFGTDATAMATIGKGSITVEEVRMIQNEEYVILESQL